jgi:hypothetical protein
MWELAWFLEKITIHGTFTYLPLFHSKEPLNILTKLIYSLSVTDIGTFEHLLLHIQCSFRA